MNDLYPNTLFRHIAWPSFIQQFRTVMVKHVKVVTKLINISEKIKSSMSPKKSATQTS